jgi:hypothetical protein
MADRSAPLTNRAAIRYEGRRSPMIAISYRRQDSSPVAGRLYDRLQAEFGKGSVFMDFDSIPYGVDFREHIKQTLQRAKVVVAIIGPEWVGAKSDSSGRRIDDPTDFVRLEVASALENGIPIIPILVNNTPMPDAKNLPPELEGLAFRNGLVLDTGIDFHHHADRLIAGIRRVLSPSATAAPVPTPVQPAESRPSGGKGLAMAALVAILLAGVVLGAWYFLGRATRTQTENVVTPRLRETTTPVVTPAIVNSTPIAAASLAATPLSSTIASVAAALPSPTHRPAPVESTKSSDPIVQPAKPAAIRTPADEAGHEYTYAGSVGRTAATFRLRFDTAGHVTGTYSQNGQTYRLEGQNPKGKITMYEYTGEERTSRLELALQESDAEIRWSGTMYNISPNTNVYPVSFSRPRR